jgi:hypothetical protein
MIRITRDVAAGIDVIVTYYLERVAVAERQAQREICDGIVVWRDNGMALDTRADEAGLRVGLLRKLVDAADRLAADTSSTPDAELYRRCRALLRKAGIQVAGLDQTQPIPIVADEVAAQRIRAGRKRDSDGLALVTRGQVGGRLTDEAAGEIAQREVIADRNLAGGMGWRPDESVLDAPPRPIHYDAIGFSELGATIAVGIVSQADYEAAAEILVPRGVVAERPTFTCACGATFELYDEHDCHLDGSDLGGES